MHALSTPRLVRRLPGPLSAVVEIPGSKSLTNRWLPLAALADGESTLRGVLVSEDTELMVAALRTLGVQVTVDSEQLTAKVQGCRGHFPQAEAEVDCGLSGTVLRFMAGLLAAQAGQYRMDGVPRLRERPVGDLVDALRRLGAQITYQGAEGFPPLLIEGLGLRGGECLFDSPPSSQLVSGLLLAAPLCRGDVLCRVEGELPSRPYLDMTLAVLREAGVEVVVADDAAGLSLIVPAPQRLRAVDVQVEPDASSASYFLAAAAAVGGEVTVLGLGSASLQGDARFCDVLALMGCQVDQGPTHTTVRRDPSSRLRGVDVNLNAMPDMAQTLAALALLADGPTTVRDVANLRVKETDRLSAVATEATRLGAQVTLRDDGWTLVPPAAITPGLVRTYGDHRMAMAFAVTGLAADGVTIEDPACVRKTFPDFFERLGQLSTRR